jgi:hypothetical protein
VAQISADLRRDLHGSDLRDSAESQLRISQQVDVLMGAVRAQLTGAVGTQYDLGIFLARIAYCANSIGAGARLSDSSPDMRAIGERMSQVYSKELARATGHFLRIASQSDLPTVFGHEYAQVFAALASHLSRELVASPESFTVDQAARVRSVADRVLGLFGFS